ncbi:MAG: hypothetical protein ABSA46_10255 [Thermodesulfovibrionales bacterium]
METVEAIIKNLKELSAVFSWPIMLLIVAYVFRSPLTNLINRITKAQHGSISIDAPLPQAQITSEASKDAHGLGKIAETKESGAASEKTGAAAFLASFDNPLIKEVEENIIADLQARKIVDALDKEKVLIRALAATQLMRLAEHIYASIWGSQVNALRFLNGCPAGAEDSVLRSFYDAAKTNYPDWYKEQTFEKWMGFLTMFKLIIVEGPHVTITVRGRQFLRYLADAGKPERVHG